MMLAASPEAGEITSIGEAVFVLSLYAVVAFMIYKMIKAVAAFVQGGWGPDDDEKDHDEPDVS